MVTTRPPKTIVKPTALGPVANTDTKLLIYGLFQKGRVLAQDGEKQIGRAYGAPRQPSTLPLSAHRYAIFFCGSRPAVATRDPPWLVRRSSRGQSTLAVALHLHLDHQAAVIARSPLLNLVHRQH